jgi:hypothetical protein
MAFLIKLLGRLYLLLFLGIARAVLRGEKNLFDAFSRALRGESRCIVAFRHPNGGEPQLLTWFILLKLKTLAARAGVKFARKPHLVFVYGYDVIRWGGWVARLVLPRLGAMPVHHAKMDSRGMARIYRAIIDGPYPLGIAPEGQVSYTSEDVPRLEQGPIRIGFHAADRLARAGKNCPVEVLPVSIHSRYGPWGKLTTSLLLRRIEGFCGLGRNSREPSLTGRLRRCREQILAVNEKRYRIETPEGASFAERLDRVIEAALKNAERILGADRWEGSLFSRLSHLRQLCWDRIFLPGLESLENLSPMERGALDLRAGEAWYASRHLELVEFAWYFRGPPPEEGAPLNMKIEYIQNLWDFGSRSVGGGYPNRINILPRRVIFQVAPPINLTERLPAYHADKKAAIHQALSDLKGAFLDCVKAVNAWD